MSNDPPGTVDEQPADGVSPIATAPREGNLTVATFEDFEAVDFFKPIAAQDIVECLALSESFSRASAAAEEAADQPATRVFSVLAALSGFHFRPSDRAQPFGPMLDLGNRRSPIPADYRGTQCDALLRILHRIPNPGLRARVADTVWLNDRKQSTAARQAIEAYSEAVEGLATGKYRPRFQSPTVVSIEQIDLATRALQIARAIHKKGAIPDGLASVVCALYETARDRVEVVPFCRCAELLLQHSQIDPLEFAKAAEEVVSAASSRPGVYHLAIKRVLDLAAEAYADLGDPVNARRCRLEGIEHTLAMRDEVPSALAKASWIRSAIEQLRGVEGTQNRQAQLFEELRTIQDRVPEEMGVVSAPIDLEEQWKTVSTIAEDFSLTGAMRELAFRTLPRPKEELREQALELAKSAPLSALMPTAEIDASGRVIAMIPGAPTSGEPSDAWFRGHIERNEQIRRQIVVAGEIEPIRRTVAANFSFTERHFYPVVARSPLVPASHHWTLALGFARLIQGDSISAAHLLIPQMEHLIRHVLISANRDPSKIMPDMLQEDRPLSAILEQMRPDLVAIFGENNTDEIDRLFNARPGPALRHEFAHGKVGAAQCFHPDVLYACWYIYHLCCAPLLPHWDDHVASVIEAEC